MTVDETKLKHCLFFGTLGVGRKKDTWFFNPFRRYFAIFKTESVYESSLERLIEKVTAMICN